MRRNMFAKADYLTGQTKIVSETDYSIRLQVGKFEVVAKYQNHKLIFLCTCKAGSMEKPCAHIMAATTHLVENNGIIKRRYRPTPGICKAHVRRVQQEGGGKAEGRINSGDTPTSQNETGSRRG